MKRIKLDIGALSAPASKGSNYIFFLYNEWADGCLPIELTPPQMHAVLSNFKPAPGSEISLHFASFSILRQFNIGMLEMEIVYDRDCDALYARLLFLRSDQEIYQRADLIDGIILAKISSAPIYIEESLMNKFSSNTVPNRFFNKNNALDRLSEELEEAIVNEEYERAAAIEERIKRIKNKS